MVGIPLVEAPVERKSVMGFDQAVLDFLDWGHLDRIRNQWFHVANVASDASSIAIGVVRFLFRGVRSQVDDGWV